jgi:hypothetical protein
MACFREFILRLPKTDGPRGDFIEDTKTYISITDMIFPFRNDLSNKPFPPFPTDWEQGWDFYEMFLRNIGACEEAIKIGKELWNDFESRYIKRTKPFYQLINGKYIIA